MGHGGNRRGLRGIGIVGLLLLAAFGPTGGGSSWAAAKAEAPPGKAVYDRLCAVCHGTAGRGDGQGLRGVPVRPRDFTDPAAMRGVTDQDLTSTIKRGGGATGKSPLMPPFGDPLKDAEVVDLISYIRSLQAPAR